MTLKEFQAKHPGGYYLRAAEDKRALYGDCDNLIVADYLYQPLSGIYTVYLIGNI